MDSLFERTYNPDVLSCLANLSNDEVFTPPVVANQVLDMLPENVWQDPNTKILDPCCKTGVFLREAAKRLIKGLEPVYPDLQERVDHVMHNQLFGISITELTSLLSRRSLYCSKFPRGRFSVSSFDDDSGHIRYRHGNHTWYNGRCIFCGASESEYGRDASLETHAYEFIHTHSPERIFDMKFDVIVGNPPYQLDTPGAGRQAKPIYNLFVEQAKKLRPRYVVMIIPSRWFAGGMGLDSFRQEMMNDRHIRQLVDFANAKDCFPQNSISGGVCYFLWDRDNEGLCEFTSVSGDVRSTASRYLNEWNVLVRYNDAVSILRKVTSLNEPTLDLMASGLMPFGLSTNFRGTMTPRDISDLAVHTSAGISYISRNGVIKGSEYLGKYKVLISKTGAEHAGEPSRDGKFRVLTSSLKVIGPNEICTHSYFVIGCFMERHEAEELLKYLKTKFARFIILQSMTSINVSKNVFQFLPQQDWSKSWADDDLNEKYSLSQNEREYIDSMIKSFDEGEQE